MIGLLGAGIAVVAAVVGIEGSVSAMPRHAPSQAHAPMLWQTGLDKHEIAENSPVSLLMQFAKDGCFAHGAAPGHLQKWAEQFRGRSVADGELSRHQNDFTKLVGGWTFSSGLGAIALIQSEFRAPRNGYVCSLTAQLEGDAQHRDVKAAFQATFASAINDERDWPDRHVDRFWIERSRQPPVMATIEFTRSSRMVTIRMVHGDAWPTQT